MRVKQDLSASNGIGTIGGVTQVVATLYCNGAASTSLPVAIDANGDFRLAGMLNPLPPDPCSNPALLIRNYANGAAGSWFAAGIMRVE